jgi:signal transduction histidine kinase
MPHDCTGVVLDAHAVVARTRGAECDLGPIAAVGTDRTQFVQSFAKECPDLAAAMQALLDQGKAFRHRAVVHGKRVEISGVPCGALCRLAVRNVANDPQEQEIQNLRAERDALRAAVSASDLSLWRLSADGTADWRSKATPSTLAPTDEAVELRIDLPDGGAVVIGRPQAAPELSPEAMLRRFVETVSETFASLRVGLAIFDRDRRLTLSNPALADLFHADPRWLSGRPTLRETLDRLREARQLPEQADYPAWRATLFTLFDGERRTYEDVWDLPDGRSLQVVARPHPMGGLVFVIEDITEAIALQRWRSTAVEVRRATLDQLEHGVAVFGTDGQLRIANPAFAQQWRQDLAVMATWHVSDFTANCGPLCRDAALWERIRAAISTTADRSPWETRVALRDGRVLKARIAPMPDGSTLVAIADISDSEQVASALRDRAAALENAEQMRDALVDHLSHRLRTPLNVITGFAEMLASGRAGELTEPQAGFVEHIREAGRQLGAGVESLDDLASIHAPPGTGGAAGAVALGPALRGAIGLLARRAEEAGVTVTVVSQTTEAVVWGDSARIRQIVYRLVSDGIAAAPRGAQLSLGAMAEGETVLLWCEGFPADTALPPPPRAEVSIETDADGRPRLVSRLPVHAGVSSGVA